MPYMDPMEYDNSAIVVLKDTQEHTRMIQGFQGLWYHQKNCEPKWTKHRIYMTLHDTV